MRKFTKPQLYFIAFLLLILTAILVSPITRGMLTVLFRGNSPGISFWAGFLRSEDPDRIFTGAAEVGGYGEQGGPAIPLMLEVIRDPERGTKPWGTGKKPVRTIVVRCIGKMGSAATPHVPEVAEFLADPDQWMRLETAMALKELGPHATAAVPALQKAGGPNTDSAPAIRVEVFKALQAIDKAALMATLRDCLMSDKQADRSIALEFALKLGADGRMLVPDLKAIAENTTDNSFRSELRELIRRHE